MTTFSWRASTDADVPAIVEIWRISSAERGIPATASEDVIRTERSRPTYDPETMSRVAEAGGRVVALLNLEHQAEQAYANGYVVPEFRGRGIGSALMRWAIEQARTIEGVTEFWSFAGAEVAGAIELIQAFGLEHVRSWFRMQHTSPSSVAE